MVRPKSFLPGPTIWGEMVFSKIWGEKWGREKIDGKFQICPPHIQLAASFIYLCFIFY